MRVWKGGPSCTGATGLYVTCYVLNRTVSWLPRAWK